MTCRRFRVRAWTVMRSARPTRAARLARLRARSSRVHTLYTGQVSPVPVGEGQCIEIATGAPLPAGADAVVMVEETDADDRDIVRVFAEVQPQQNVGRQGADIKAGQVVVRAGETLNSSRVGALAAVGTVRVNVYQRPRVAILSTGNEVVVPGTTLEPGQIYDINRFTLAAVVVRKRRYCRSPIPLRPTRSMRSSRRSTISFGATSSSFLEAARSVSAI